MLLVDGKGDYKYNDNGDDNRAFIYCWLQQNNSSSSSDSTRSPSLVRVLPSHNLLMPL